LQGTENNTGFSAETYKPVTLPKIIPLHPIASAPLFEPTNLSKLTLHKLRNDQQSVLSHFIAVAYHASAEESDYRDSHIPNQRAYGQSDKVLSKPKVAFFSSNNAKPHLTLSLQQQYCFGVLVFHSSQGHIV